MIRWTHYTERLTGGGIVERYTKHTLALLLFRRYLIVTWVWTT